MAEGLYPNGTVIERFLATVTPQTLGQRIQIVADGDLIGMVLYVSTAPGTGNGVSVNLSCVPTSQITNVPAAAQNQSVVSPYNLWSSTNVPTILGSATASWVSAPALATVANVPYALNYPMPGPSGTSGLKTAQATLPTTETPVTSPQATYQYEMANPYPPDLSYLDMNGQLQPTYRVHAGDILSCVVSAAGANVSVGSAANLLMTLAFVKA
jgi:hypothetical protein